VLDAVRGPAQPGSSTTAALVAHAARTGLTVLGWTPASRSLQARVGWARRALGESWPDVSDTALIASAPEWLTPALKGARGRSELARVDPSAAIRAALGGRSAELDRLLPGRPRAAGWKEGPDCLRRRSAARRGSGAGSLRCRRAPRGSRRSRTDHA
jgi:HrpA-like RNA helicase